MPLIIFFSRLFSLLIFFSYFLYSLYKFFVLIFSIFSFLIKPNSPNCFLNSLSGILFSFIVKFLFFLISFKYFPRYNNFISYSFSFSILISFISLISKEEKGKNNTSLSFGKNDIFSISPCVDKLYPRLSSFSSTNNTFDKFKLLFLFFKNFSATFLSFEKDKNDLENTIELGKSFTFFFK